MEALFKPAEAVAWLEKELTERCRGSTVHVTVYPGGGRPPQRLEGNVKDMLPAIADACQNFPVVEMEMHPRNVYGYFGVMICSCTEDTWEKCPLKCKTFTDRPKVTVIVPSNGMRCRSAN